MSSIGDPMLQHVAGRTVLILTFSVRANVESRRAGGEGEGNGGGKVKMEMTET